MNYGAPVNTTCNEIRINKLFPTFNRQIIRACKKIALFRLSLISDFFFILQLHSKFIKCDEIYIIDKWLSNCAFWRQLLINA